MEEYQESAAAAGVSWGAQRQDLIDSIRDTERRRFRISILVSRQKFCGKLSKRSTSISARSSRLSLAVATGEMRLTDQEKYSGFPGSRSCVRPLVKRLQNVLLLSGGEKGAGRSGALDGDLPLSAKSVLHYGTRSMRRWTRPTFGPPDETLAGKCRHTLNSS